MQINFAEKMNDRPALQIIYDEKEKPVLIFMANVFPQREHQSKKEYETVHPVYAKTLLEIFLPCLPCYPHANYRTEYKSLFKTHNSSAFLQMVLHRGC